jgi:hypothetical protein
MAKRGGGEGGLHEMNSGLIHTADSLADAPHGRFVDKFGPPGDPTQRAKTGGDRGFGSQPDLLRGIAGGKRP